MDNKFSNIDLQAWKPWIFQGQQAPHQDQGLAMGHLCRTGYLQSAIGVDVAVWEATPHQTSCWRKPGDELSPVGAGFLGR